MRPVDYDRIASEFDRRYAVNEYGGTERALLDFIGSARLAGEVGCGTGHWVALLRERGLQCLGVDYSGAMVRKAAQANPGVVARADAHALPWRTASLDRVFCVNALHHFREPSVFFREALRVLRPGGAVFTTGLDPHTGRDQWWIYDFFPAALPLDRQRYLPASRIREAMEAAGFVGARTDVSEHFPVSLSYDDALARGILDRRSASQLLVISDDDFAAGIERIHRERPMISADLRLYATTARVP